MAMLTDEEWLIARRKDQLAVVFDLNGHVYSREELDRMLASLEGHRVEVEIREEIPLPVIFLGFNNPCLSTGIYSGRLEKNKSGNYAVRGREGSVSVGWYATRAHRYVTEIKVTPLDPALYDIDVLLEQSGLTG